MAIKNNILALIKTRDMDAEFVKVEKNTMKENPDNEDLVILRIARGWRKWFRKIPGRWFTQINIPKHWLFAYPGGMNTAISSPERTIFLCGVKNHCHDSLMDDYEIALVEASRLDEIISTHMNEIEKLSETIEDLRITLRKTQIK